MAGEAGQSQGAGLENLSDGQTSGAGAPEAPKVNNAPIPNANGSGDGVVPKDDVAAQAADKAAEAAKTKEQQSVEHQEEEQTPAVVEYQQWEDPSANAAVELLKEAGVSAVEAGAIFNKAIESGNLTDIDVAALEAKVGKTKALLIMNGVTDYHRRTIDQNQKTVTAVHEIFGGQQGWNTVREWAQAKEKVDPSFKKELDDIRDDLNKGGRAAKAAAKDLLNMYNGSPQTKGLGNQNIVKGQGKPAASGAPLSRADYVTELKKAHAEGANPTVLAQLDARRRAGMQAGI